MQVSISKSPQVGIKGRMKRLQLLMINCLGLDGKLGKRLMLYSTDTR